MTDAVRLSHGLQPDTDLLVSVEDVESGIGCGLVCPECRRRLIAAKGPQYRHHFRHEADDAVCVGALETMRHKLAKQVLAERKVVWLPPLDVRVNDKTGRTLAHEVVTEGGKLTFDAVGIEVWRNGIRPDAIGFGNAAQIAIEIFVSHQCDAEKIAAFARLGLAAIEIGVADYHEPVHGDYGDYVLRNAPRWWLFHPDAAAARARLQAEQDRLAALKAAKEEEARLLQERATALWRQRQAAEEAARQKRLEEIERRAAAAAAPLNRRSQPADGETPGWPKQTPEQQAAMCAGLLKGFNDHYYALRDLPESIARRSKPPADEPDDDAEVAA